MLALLAVGGFAFASSSAADEESHTYKLEMFNAFGLVEGSEVKVAGVNAGTVEGLTVSEDKTALVEVQLSGPLAVLGVDTECSSEPQSLIAEYFIDCQPAGEPAEDGETLRKKVAQTVQPDLVQNTLREPFKDRLAILINEFGTALAGNPENLNEAIRLGAPALDDLDSALRILAKQNNVIRDLNVDSDVIVGKLADRRGDVVAFIENAGEAAEASAERSDDLSRNFDQLDDFLVELEPTMVELGNVARETTPLLADLRGAAPQLNELAVSLPPFNRVTRDSLVSLGDAAIPGRRALKKGVQRGTFQALADAGKRAPAVAERLKDFLADLDDPGRAVEVDKRAARTCNDKTRPCFSTGRRGPTGYSGFEGLLNYPYYQGGALNSYDDVGHLLHFSLYNVFQGPCGDYNAAQDYPAEGGGRTTNLLAAENCVGGLGPTQPGISESEESICAQAPADQICSPTYDPAACPQGSATPDCVPAAPRRTAASNEASGGASGRGARGGNGSDPAGLPGDPALPGVPDLPDLPVGPEGASGGLGDVINNLPGLNPGKKNGGKGGGNGAGGSGDAANDLLDFLFAP